MRCLAGARGHAVSNRRRSMVPRSPQPGGCPVPPPRHTDVLSRRGGQRAGGHRRTTDARAGRSSGENLDSRRGIRRLPASNRRARQGVCRDGSRPPGACDHEVRAARAGNARAVAQFRRPRAVSDRTTCRVGGDFRHPSCRLVVAGKQAVPRLGIDAARATAADCSRARRAARAGLRKRTNTRCSAAFLGECRRCSSPAAITVR